MAESWLTAHQNVCTANHGPRIERFTHKHNPEMRPLIRWALPAGNVFEPRGLDELIPDWKERGAPVASPVTEDSFSFLTETKAFKIPNALLPPQLVSE